MRAIGLALGLATLLMTSRGWSYASFVGFGYVSCMTCHYNPHGNGQLNDYGRALFASEIAARPFWNSKISDEKLADRSSFTFRKPGSGRFKPSLKYRELQLTTSPGGSNTNRRIVMQADLGFALHFDAADKYILVMSAGYTPTPINNEIKDGAWNYHLLSREHYLRVQLNDEQFLSVGLMDIVYGLRLVDHTAVNRKDIGLDQNDQVHGLLYDYFKDKWMFAVHAFAGNQMREQVNRLSGASATMEYEVKEKLTVGSSALSAGTPDYKRTLFGLHSRVGVGKGSSLMAELGLNRLEPKATDATTGTYGILAGTMRLVRGLDFESVFEMLKTSLADSVVESYRYSFGFIYFPFQRVELRFHAFDSRSLSPTEVKGDTWAVQSQLHFSL